jgi:hypothetical protein
MTIKELYKNNPLLTENIIIASQTMNEFSCKYTDFGTFEMVDIIVSNFDEMIQEYNKLTDDTIPEYEFFTEYLKNKIEENYKSREE